MNHPGTTRPDRRRGALSRIVLAFALALSFVATAHAQQGREELIIEDPGVPVDPIDPIDPGTGEGGWTRTPVQIVDDAGRTIPTEIYQIEGLNGVAFAPIPEIIRDQLIEELAQTPVGENAVFSLNAPIVDEIQRSIALGYATPALIEYANQDTEYVALGTGTGTAKLFGSCSDSHITRNRRLQFSPSIGHTLNLGNGLSGTMRVDGVGNLDANGEVRLRVKRARVFGICVPYGVRLQHARAVGNVTLESTLNLTGSVTYANPNPIEQEIFKVPLGGIGFMAGPIPVYIGFDLPVTIGMEIKASVTGQIQYRGGHRITGSFDYLCTPSSCSGFNNIQTTTQNIANPWGAGISGRIQPSLYAELAVRAYLYDKSVAYVKVGVQGFLHGDLWGYYGNACGDADQNGHFETVSALTFGLDWQVKVIAKADTFFTSAWKTTLWKNKPQYIGFWDLLSSGSSALTPMLDGPSSIPAGSTASYRLRMRPCFPYTDDIDYTMNWGDGTVTTHKGPPAPPSWQPVLASHVFATTGARTLQLTALRDKHGREFGSGRTTSRNLMVTTAAPINHALSASVLASSTFCSGTGTVHCYSPQRVNDGDRSTTLGGFTSWSNNQGTAMPQWVELRWSGNITFSRVDLYTSDGYPIRDYDIEYWNGTSWVKAVIINGNTSLSRSHTVTPVMTSRIRVLGRSGPTHQPGYVRVNEIEVY